MGKKIEIDVSGTKKMVIQKDDAGKLVGVSDENGNNVPAMDLGSGKLSLEGVTITSVSDGAVITTHSSPGCVYYFIGGQYYRICS